MLNLRTQILTQAKVKDSNTLIWLNLVITLTKLMLIQQQQIETNNKGTYYFSHHSIVGSYYFSLSHFYNQCGTNHTHACHTYIFMLVSFVLQSKCLTWLKFKLNNVHLSSWALSPCKLVWFLRVSYTYGLYHFLLKPTTISSN